MYPGKAVKSPFAKFTHVGLVVRDVNKSTEKLKSLGIGTFKVENEPRGGLIVSIAEIGDKTLELRQPTMPGSPQMDFLKNKGDGIDHIAFSVEDIDKEKCKLTTQGFAVKNSGKDFANFDTGIGGITFELVRVQPANQYFTQTGSVHQESLFATLRHVGIVVQDASDAMKRLASAGISPFEAEVLPPKVECSLYQGKPYCAKVKGYSARIGDMHLEIHQPIEGAGPHMTFLRTKGEGFDHLGFFVDDIEKETREFVKRGASLLRSITWEGGGSAYFDINLDGVMVELVQGWVKTLKNIDG
jgi:methylmalonyl-CoA/ethylmalonyl-CoA epimerase